VVTAIPRIVVAAPASGSGKTTVATGLMAALRSRGLTVSAHKVGPDFIDPTYHSLATGRPGRNLDAFLCAQELIAPLFLHGARGADIAVVEGVMGLYDGVRGTDVASTAHVAKLLDAPVLLVVDARSMSGSVAAMVHGFRDFDRGVRVAGVLLNRVGSPTHESMLRSPLRRSASRSSARSTATTGSPCRPATSASSPPSRTTRLAASCSGWVSRSARRASSTRSSRSRAPPPRCRTCRGTRRRWCASR
jgi:hypothetical protein